MLSKLYAAFMVVLFATPVLGIADTPSQFEPPLSEELGELLVDVEGVIGDLTDGVLVPSSLPCVSALCM